VKVDLELEGDQPETYEPQPTAVMDGEALLADPVEFFEITHSIAAFARDGALYVLRRDSLKWVNVEALPKPSGAKLSAINKAPQ
jgi:hypothetical protein